MSLSKFSKEVSQALDRKRQKDEMIKCHPDIFIQKLKKDTEAQMGHFSYGYEMFLKDSRRTLVHNVNIKYIESSHKFKYDVYTARPSD